MGKMQMELPAKEGSRYGYGILVDEVCAEGFCCESYGVCVWEREGGERAEVRHVTTSPTRMDELMARLAAHEVAPCHLRAVIEDCL